MSQRFVDVVRNPLSLMGAIVTTLSAVLILTLVLLGLVGFEAGPYLGIVVFVILPAFFVLGLLLIPVGVRLERRRAAKGRAPMPLVIRLGLPRTQRLVLVVAALSAVNLIVLSLATYKAVEVMDTPAFCGSCHTVGPERASHQRSPHARVACVACHIGPGATWYVKAKLSGTMELLHNLTGNYPRPLPVPVHDLRPARDTCETCHWPSKFVGSRLVVKTAFTDDEANTPKKTVLLMHIGGGGGAQGRGIHYHVSPGVRIRYLADSTLQNIGLVELTLPDGTQRLFLGQGGPIEAGPGAAWRTMDCIDCHNRPAHIYVSAEVAIDQALEGGRIARTLPFVRREGLKLLQPQYASQPAARKAIHDGLIGFYAKAGSADPRVDPTAVEAAANALGELWAENNFPEMKIAWGTYPSFIGHIDSPGCFRCHGGDHTTRDGKASIPMDCGLCHTLLAQDEKDPKILKDLHP